MDRLPMLTGPPSVSLRIQTTKANKAEFPKVSPERCELSPRLNRSNNIVY